MRKWRIDDFSTYFHFFTCLKNTKISNLLLAYKKAYTQINESSSMPFLNLLWAYFLLLCSSTICYALLKSSGQPVYFEVSQGRTGVIFSMLSMFFFKSISHWSSFQTSFVTLNGGNYRKFYFHTRGQHLCKQKNAIT